MAIKYIRLFFTINLKFYHKSDIPTYDMDKMQYIPGC